MRRMWREHIGARLGAMRFGLQEAGGAFGDLGTFIPIVVSLVVTCDLDIGSILFFAGLANIVTGFLFNQPIPVQPMKAIAAVAIAQLLSPGMIAAAGLGVGLVVFILAVTGLIQTVERLVPRAIVRGIQLGVGLKLLSKGVIMASDAWLMAGIALGLVLLSLRWKRFPSAMVLFMGGLAYMVVANPGLTTDLSFGWSGPVFSPPTMAEWKAGLVQGGLPQIPLTLLNSVIAVCALSADLYPGRGIGTRSMALSVGLMNMIGCWFGAMPMCHGAGGLAGQHRFGGRTGGAVVLLGVGKVVLGITLGSAAAVLLAAYPGAILGVLLCFAGVELARPVRDCKTRDEIILAVATAAGILIINTAVGFAVGLVGALLLKAVHRK